MMSIQRPNGRKCCLWIGYALTLGTLLSTGLAFGQVSYTQLVFGTVGSSYAAIPSYVVATPPVNLEVADDFLHTGPIGRVRMNGTTQCLICQPLPILAAEVRFYADGMGEPGPLQYSASIPIGTPGFVVQPSPSQVEVVLPTPFVAGGRHWVSVQLVFNGAGFWSIWNGNQNAPSGTPIRVRDNLGSGTWGPYFAIPGMPLNSDLSFALYGPAAPQPNIDPCGPWLGSPGSAGIGAIATQPQDICVIGAADAWAVGYGNIPTSGGIQFQTFAMHWDGAAWTTTPTPNPGFATMPNNGVLRAVDGLVANDVWAGGGMTVQLAGGWLGSQSLVTRWDGSQWSVVPTPIPNSSLGGGSAGTSIEDLIVLGPNEVWFVGDRTEVFAGGLTTQPGLLMRWDGAAFTMFDSPPTPNNSVKRFRAVAASGSTEVWAVGAAFPGVLSGGSPYPLIYRFDGTNWNYIAMNNPGPGNLLDLYDVEVLAPGDAWILGRSYTSLTSGATFLAHSVGGTWTFFPGPPNCTSLHVYASNAMHAAGNGVWYFDGATWTQTETFPGFSNPSLSGIDAAYNCEPMVTGGRYVAGASLSFGARIDVGSYLLDLAQPGDGTVHLRTVGWPVSTSEGYTAVSATVSQPVGTGPNYGIVADLLTWDFLALFPSPAPGNPLHWAPTGPTAFPNVAFVIPPTVSAALQGQSWDFVGVALDPFSNVLDATPVRRLTW